MKNRNSIRLSDIDYSAPGSYFITICSQKKKCIFGDIKDEELLLNKCGKIARDYWLEIPEHFNRAEIDEFIVMPNHVHGIINLVDNAGAGHPSALKLRWTGVQPNNNKYQKIIPGSIGSIIRSYKSAVTKWIHENTDIIDVWQRNYYEHIIQNEDELYRIRKYINYNPLSWQIEKIEHGNKDW